MTLPWWMITVGGLLGSSHCLGMCGGFALMLGMNRPSLWENLRRQLLFSCGRIFSYSALGGVAGFAGMSFARRLPSYLNGPAVLSLVAGLFLLWEGLHATGMLKWRSRSESAVTVGAGCLYSSIFSPLLRHPALRTAFAAGIFTGLLPCGLVYSFVALAASSEDLLQGAFTMMAFGLGTVPLMVLAGTGATLLSRSTRRWVWQIAAWSVVVTGVLTIERGVAQWSATDKPPEKRCPFCAPTADPGKHESQGLNAETPLRQ